MNAYIIFSAAIVATRMMIPRPPTKFMADRPFFFALVNRTPHASLFGGRFVKP